MTNITPNDDPNQVPEKKTEKPSVGSDKDSAKLTLGDVAPLTRESLKPIKSGINEESRETILDFGVAGRNPDVNKLGGLTFELKRELSLNNFRDQQRQAQQARQSEETTREFRWMHADTRSGVNALGNRQFFRYLKAEDIKPPSETKPFPELKTLTDKFLTQTEPRENNKLTQAEERDLEQSRRQLAEATTPTELLSNTIHLARLYQHLRYIDEAKKALYLALGIDPDNPQVRQLFKELERMHPVDVGITSQAMSNVALTKSALRKCIKALTGGKIIVAGDLLIDELVEGKPERISREAPVLILEHVDTVHIPGGAANTAHNITALGGTCHAIGVCGEDEHAGIMADMLSSHGITHGLVRDSSRPTTVKTRILSKSHSQMQQLLRLDRISHEIINAEIEKAVIAKLHECASGFKALVLSDYKAGVITDGIIEACRAISKLSNILIVVDAQQKFERFKGVALMTPNQPDTEKFVGYKLDSREALKRAGDEILAATGAKALLITRGGDGMCLFEQNQAMRELPAFNRSEVFDVTGAGDTVIGTMTLALVTGATYLEAMALGNLAAGIVVRKPGTAVTSQREMLENLELLNLPE